MQTHAANHQWEAASRVHQQSLQADLPANISLLIQIACFVTLVSPVTQVVTTGGAAVTSVHLGWLTVSAQPSVYLLVGNIVFSVVFQLSRVRRRVFFFFLLSSNSNVQNFFFFSAKNDTFPDIAEMTSQTSVISVISEWYLWKGITEDMRWNPRVWRQPWDWVLSASRGTKSSSRFEEDRRERCSKASQRSKKFYFFFYEEKTPTGNCSDKYGACESLITGCWSKFIYFPKQISEKLMFDSIFWLSAPVVCILCV